MHVLHILEYVITVSHYLDRIIRQHVHMICKVDLTFDGASRYPWVIAACFQSVPSVIVPY